MFDDSPSIKEFVPEGLWFILHEDEETAGFIHLNPLTNATWMCHVYIFELHRKKGSEEWGKQVAQFMKGNKLLALTPYESAKKYAERIGFKYITTLTKSIKKNNVLLDQYLLELGEMN